MLIKPLPFNERVVATDKRGYVTAGKKKEKKISRKWGGLKPNVVLVSSGNILAFYLVELTRIL